MKRQLAILILTSVTSFAAHARELTETWASARAMGMGNAYTAHVSNSDALFYNPAGLALGGGFKWTLFDPRVGASPAAISDVSNLASADDVSEMLADLYNTPLWAGLGMKSAVQFGPIAFAGFGGADVSGLLTNPAYPTFGLNYFVDYGGVVGIGLPVGPLLNIGGSFRRITRTGTSAPLSAADLAEAAEDPDGLTNRLKNTGTGYGMDIGAILTIPSPVRPLLSFVWKNIGNTEFDLEEGEAPPQRIESEMILGAALQIDLPLITITPALDYKHLNRNDVQLGNKLHVGVEVALPAIELRAGLNQGYYTAGAGLNTGILRVDAATYGVELGAYPGQLEDRRYMVQVSFELGFDSPFSDSGDSASGGGKSGRGGRGRLKQRR